MSKEDEIKMAKTIAEAAKRARREDEEKEAAQVIAFFSVVLYWCVLVG